MWPIPMQRMLRLMSVGTVLLGIVALFAACAPTPFPALSVFIRGGALHATDGSPRWRSELGEGPPPIVNGVAYPTFASHGDDTTPADTVAAVRTSDGATLWRFHVPAQARVGGMVVSSDRVVVLVFQQPDTLTPVALRASDGDTVWHGTAVAAALRQTYDVASYVYATPTIVNALVVAQIFAPSQDFTLDAWNISDGTLAWQRPPFDDASAHGPRFAQLTPAGSTLIANYGSGYGSTITQPLTGLDPHTGATLWQTAVASVDAITPQVIVSSDPSSQEITGRRPGDGAVLWQQTLNASGQQYLTSIALNGTTLYYRQYEDCAQNDQPPYDEQCHVHFYALDLASGHMLWDRKLGTPLDLYGSQEAFYGEGTLYLIYPTTPPSQRRTLAAFSGNDGSSEWTHTEDEAGYGPPLVAYGIIWMVLYPASGACGTNIEAVSAQDGVRLWQRPYAPCPLLLQSPHWIEVA